MKLNLTLKSLKALITLLFTLIFMAVSVVGLGVYGARGSTLLTPHEVVLSNSHNGIIIKWNGQVCGKRVPVST